MARRLAAWCLLGGLSLGCGEPGRREQHIVAASESAAVSAATASPEGSPVGSYDAGKLASYAPNAACVELCAAAMRCRTTDLFGGGPRAVAYRLEHCRFSCQTKRIARPAGYLEAARACLVAADCEVFQRCVSELLPPELGKRVALPPRD
jgi:hypothetical protein